MTIHGWNLAMMVLGAASMNFAQWLAPPLG